MTYYIISRDGAAIGFAGANESIGALPWFAKNVHAYSMDHALKHEGYSVAEVEDLDCHAVAPLLEAIAARIGLKVDFEFVPLSKSRNAGKWDSLNWRVTVRGRAPSRDLVTDYSAGIGHAPASQRNGWFAKTDKARAARTEAETGKICVPSHNAGNGFFQTNKPVPAPAIGDVLHSLVQDSNVLDYSGFEDWASDYGHDLDSRKAEAAYRACLEIALKIKAAVGAAVFAEMRLVSQFN